VSYLDDPLAVRVCEYEYESQLCIEFTHKYRVICILNATNHNLKI